MTTKIGDLLLKEKLITAEQLSTALEHQKKYGGKIGSVLVELEYNGIRVDVVPERFTFEDMIDALLPVLG